MADIDRDVQNVTWLESFASRKAGRRRDQQPAEAEAPGFADMLIVNLGGLFSVALASLGVWKLAELII
ncbi:hypothetical protein Plav_0584 [Parvibaculum lavamentivorans DS-1]|uniref:Uncharacterized protein n=1 Tax=Parvibaculum lavamentivorans (strain DS-1 / DSM 13023 / NCIMB 13966) TaxID=402881 RepID=A7HQM4_PARL1|nr:hypothetical protein [Parvibaculum lavamentivorans]ABS62207.1 hypothetical protein Plav_0584 [Parvibaculum lavamentivorans DS-1]